MDKKKNFGQFFTPKDVAKAMVGWCIHKDAEKILDPTCGPGIFLQCAHELRPGMYMTAYEIDPEMAELFRQGNPFPVELYEQDYLESEVGGRFDAIVCNPPYGRFHEVKERSRLADSFGHKYGVHLSTYTNYCFYFLIKSLQELADGGRMAYLVPYEFLNTGYGRKIKKYLLQSGMLRGILKFDSSHKVFSDAMTTVCILLFEKEACRLEERDAADEDVQRTRRMHDGRDAKDTERVLFAEICDFSQLDWLLSQTEPPEADGIYQKGPRQEADGTYQRELRQEKEGIAQRELRQEEVPHFDIPNYRYYRMDELHPEEKWLSYFPSVADGISNIEHLIPLKELAYVKRGLATGNNVYFTFSEEERVSRGISQNACRACIRKSRDITVPKLNKAEYQKLLRQNKRVYLFDGCRAATEGDFAYIRTGEENGYHRAYLTRHRSPWYRIEYKEPAPIWVTVFNRSSLKVVRNEMMIYALTAFHGIYVAPEYADLLFCYLLTPSAQEIIFQNKREYGEGLDKFEPGDLNNAKILDIRCLGEEDRAEVLRIYRKLNKRNCAKMIQRLDGIFQAYLK